MFQKKTPKFFCDNCSTEVHINAKNCPGCGRFFSSVRCPACGFSGEEDRFRNGCPKCGYSALPEDSRVRNKGQPKAAKSAPDPLPFWIYILASAVFAAVLAALAFTFLN